MSRYRETIRTVHRDIDEEKYSNIVNPWFKYQDAYLYKFVMSEFMSEFHIRLQ